MATLVKKNNKYYIRIRHGGKETTISTQTGNKREAERRLRLVRDREVLAKAHMIEENQLIDVDLRDAKEKFLKYCREKGLRPGTIRSYKYTFINFFRAVSPQLPVRMLNEGHIKKFVSLMHTRKIREDSDATLSPNSINVNIRQLNAFTRWLRKNKYTMYDLKHEKMRVDKPLPRYLTPDELDKIYEQCGKNQRLISTLKVYEGLGLRLSELHHSRREGEFVIIEAEHSKGRRQRHVPIPPDLIEHYEYAMQNLYNPTSLSHMFRKKADDAGIDSRKSFHSLRHTYALRKLMEYDNVVLVQKLLGHQNVETTMIYTNFDSKYLEEVLTKKSQTPSASEPGTRAQA